MNVRSLCSYQTVHTLYATWEFFFLVGGLSWFQVRMVKAAVVGCGPRLTHKTHTQAKSLCDHSNEAESAEPLAKPQQHFTIASPQLCVCVCVGWK